MRIYVLVLLLSLPAFAQDKTLSETANNRILIAQHKVIEAQTNIALAQQLYTIAQNAYKEASLQYALTVSREAQAAGLPADTQVTVNVAADTVAVVPKPAAETEKPAPKTVKK